MRRVEHSEKYKEIGERLIRDLPEFRYILENDVRIAFLSSDEEKKKNRRIIFADCNKVSAQYAWTCEYDFFIKVYEPNILFFDDDQLETLIRHELHHVGIDEDGEERSFYVIPHDIEEFWEIINEKGLEWDRNKQEG